MRKKDLEIDIPDEMMEKDGVAVEKTTSEQHEYGEIIVGLDIGTTKICCIVAEAFSEEVQILGTGIVPSQGMKKGVVINIESTVASIRKAVELAEEDANIDLKGMPVYVGIAGNHIKGFNSPGILTVNREIRPADIRAVTAAASTVKISENQQIIHVMEQEFMVDNHTGIQNPVGMTGVRLATNVYIVTADNAAVHNMVTCCRQAGLEVKELVLESIASSHAVLSKDELDLGVVLIDIGGGTSDLAVFYDGSIRHISEVNLGGHNLTSDVSVSLRTPLQNAERLKEDFGGAIAAVIKPNMVVEVPTVGSREPRRATQKVLVEILEARMLEILEILNRELVASNWKNKINGGIVFTGGTALLANLAELAEQVFDLPVRVGYPDGITGKVEILRNPRCTTAVGLILYGKNRGEEREWVEDSLWGRIKAWFKNML